MNTAKFRIWNGTEMCYDVVAGRFGVFFVNPEKGDGLNPEDTASLSVNTTKYHEDTPLMLASGIKDKKGNEIYDRDIFKLGAEKKLFEVRFEHGCFLAYCGEKQYGLLGELHNHFIEKVGNAFENPELLK